MPYLVFTFAACLFFLGHPALLAIYPFPFHYIFQGYLYLVTIIRMVCIHEYIQPKHKAIVHNPD